MREDPVISDRVCVSGGSTEGSLGRWLAQRQAALRGCWRRGHGRRFVCSVSCRFSLEHTLCHE